MANFISPRLRSHLSFFKADPQISLSEFIKPSIITSTIKELKITYRERIYTPFTLLYGMISQLLSDDGSCKSAVFSIIAMRLASGKELCSSSTGAYCIAKSRLPIAFFFTIARKIAESIGTLPAHETRWKHGMVKVVDGTGISMLDTPKNLEIFQRNSNDRKKVGFSQGRLVGVFSLATGCLIDLVVGSHMGKGTGELNLMRQLWHCFVAGDTLLGDSLYSNYWVIARALRDGVNVVAEFPQKRWKRINKKLDEQWIVIEKPLQRNGIDLEEYDQAPEKVTVRIVKITCAPKGFRPKTKYIITTHLDEKKIPAQDIAALYRERWQVEICLRSIKTTLGMDFLRAKSPDMILKEIWSYMLVYNLLRLMMAKVGAVYGVCPTQLSFRAAQQILIIVRMSNLSGVFDESIIDILLLSNIVISRPDRYEPRSQKKRHKNFTFLQEPRKKARSRLYKKYKCQSQVKK